MSNAIDAFAKSQPHPLMNTGTLMAHLRDIERESSRVSKELAAHPIGYVPKEKIAEEMGKLAACIAQRMRTMETLIRAIDPTYEPAL